MRKTNLKLSKMASLVLIITLSLTITSCSNSVPSTPVQTGIVLEHGSTLFANSYDVRISIDGSTLATHAQGEKKIYELSLTEGSHKIEFSEVGNDANTENETIEVVGGEYYYFFIQSQDSGIKIVKRDTMTIDEATAVVVEPEPSNIPIPINYIVGVAIAVVALIIILMLIKSRKTKRTANRYKQYTTIVADQNTLSIDKIATTVGLSYNTVKKDLNTMINKGYLTDAYINQNSREIVLKQQEGVYSSQQIISQSLHPQMVKVLCSGCGAPNVVVPGSVSKCDFCDAPISA